MAFTQIVTVEGADDQALHDLMGKWHADQSGVAPGYLGCRVFADDKTGHHLIEVDFASQEDARRNNDRPETEDWVARLRELVTGDPPTGTCGRSAPRTRAPEGDRSDCRLLALTG